MPVDDEIRTVVRNAGAAPTAEQRRRMHPLAAVEVLSVPGRRRLRWILAAAAVVALVAAGFALLRRDEQARHIVTTPPPVTSPQPTATSTAPAAPTTEPLTPLSTSTSSTVPIATVTQAGGVNPPPPVVEADLFGRWKVDGSDAYLMFGWDGRLFVQGCWQLQWSFDGTVHVEGLEVGQGCAVGAALDGTVVTHDGDGALRFTSVAGAVRLAGTVGVGGVDLERGSIFGFAPLQTVDPEIVKMVFGAPDNLPVADSGWFVVSQRGEEDCFGGATVRVLGAGDRRLAMVADGGTEHAVVLGWAVGDPVASTIGDDRIWSAVAIGEPSPLRSSGSIDVQLGEPATEVLGAGESLPPSPTQDGGQRHIDVGDQALRDGLDLHNGLTEGPDGLITGYGAGINGC